MRTPLLALLLLAPPLLAPALSAQEPFLSTPHGDWARTTPLLSPAGDRLVVGPWLLDTAGERVLAHRPGLGGMHQARFSADGRRVLLWSREGELALLDAGSGEALASRGPGSGKRLRIEASPDLSRIVMLGTEGTTVLDGTSFEVQAEWGQPGGNWAALCADGSRLAFGTQGSVMVWSGVGEPTPLDLPADLAYREARFLGDGRTLLLVGREPWRFTPTQERLLRVDVETGTVTANVLIQHNSSLRGLDEELGVLVLAARAHGNSGTRHRVEVRRLEDLELIGAHDGVCVALLRPGTGSLLLGDSNGVTRAVDPLDQELLWEREQPVTALQVTTSLRPWIPDGTSPLPWFNPDGRLLGTDPKTGLDTTLWPTPLQPLTLGRDPSGGLWCAYSGGRLERLDGTTLAALESRELGESLTKVVAAGTRLLCTTSSGHAVLVELEGLEVLGREACGRGAAISHRGGRVLLMGGGSQGAVARLWDPASGRTEPLAVQGIRRAAVSEQGTALVILEGGEAKLLINGEVRSIEPAPDHHTSTVPVLHPDGAWAFLGCGGSPESSVLYAVVLGGADLAERRLVRIGGDFVFGGEVRRAALSPDGTRLACTTGDYLLAMTFDTRTWKRLWRRDSTGGNAGWTETAFSRDGTRLAQWGVCRPFFLGSGGDVQVLEQVVASHLVPGEEGAPAAWLSGPSIHLGDPGSSEYVERTTWSSADVVLHVDGQDYQLTGDARRAHVRVLTR